MLKNALALLVVGSCVADNSFASIKHILMKDSFNPSSLVAKHATQEETSKFNGSWTGVCSDGNGNEQVNFKITDDGTFFTLENTGMGEIGKGTYMIGTVESRSFSSQPIYASITHKMTRDDANTMRLENSSIISDMPTVDDDSVTNTHFSSTNVTILLTVNNNQLTINQSIQDSSLDKKTESKCNLKRTG